MRPTLFSMLAVAGLLLSGCTSPDAEPGLGQSSLVRRIVATIDEDRAEVAGRAGSVEGAIASFATVTYEYTHSGDDVSPKDLTFHYVLATGTPGSAPLSKFTTKATLKEGDLVTIKPSPAAGIFGAVRIEDAAGESVAARSGNAADWFTIANYPIPFAATKSGTTAWDMDGSGSVAVEIRDYELPPTTSYECDEYDCHEVSEPSGYIHEARFELGVDVGSSLSIKSAKDAVGFSTDATIGYDLDFALDMETPEMTIDGTAVGDITIEADGRLDLSFDPKREIEEVAYSASIKVDGNIDVDGFPGAEPPTEHPWFQDSVPRTTHPLNLGSKPAEKALYEFLLAAYAMDIAQGDEIRLVARGPIGMDGRTVEMQYVSQVLGVEDRTVAGKQRPAFKVADTFGIQFKDGATVEDERKIELTYWVDTATSLPVYAQSKVQQTLDGADIDESLSSIRGMSGVEIPEIPADARLVFTSEATQKMTAYGGDLETAAIVGVGAARFVPMLGAIGLMSR